MNQPTSPSDNDCDDDVGQLVEEFLELARADGGPSVAEFVSRHPEYAERLLNVLPMMLAMEGLADRDPANNSQQPGDASQAERARHATPRGQTLSIPDRIGDYRIIQEIGRGGMGIVYRAEQVSLGRHVALKILYALPSSQSTRLERFEREARITAQLHHTNILPVFEVGTHDNVSFFAMQFIEGQSLDRVIHALRGGSELQPRTQAGEAASDINAPTGQASPSHPSMLAMSLCTATGLGGDGEAGSAHDLMQRLLAETRSGAPDTGDDFSVDAPRVMTAAGLRNDTTPETGGTEKPQSLSSTGDAYFRNAASLIQQAAEALGYAHAQGVLHRDIKPGNLLLDRNHRLWVSDFGLARELDSNLTATGEILGTLRYMAPEQFRGEADQRTDIYSLGLTFYELLTRRAAFGDSDLATDKSSRVPKPPSQIESAIPRDLETICLKCIDPEPDKRYQTASEVAEEIGRFLRGEPIAARRIGTLERLVRWSRRNPIIARLTVALIIVFVSGFIGVSVMWMRAEDERGIAEYERGAALHAQGVAEKERGIAQHERSVARAEEQRANSALNDLRQTQAAAWVSPLASLFSAGNAAEVRHRLEQLVPKEGEPDQRSFEWHYWWNQLRGHDEMIRFSDCIPRELAVSPDGQLLAILATQTTGRGSTVLLWNLREHQLEGTINSPLWNPSSIDFQRRGANRRDAAAAEDAGQPVLLAIGCTDRTVRLVDVATFQWRDPIRLPPVKVEGDAELKLQAKRVYTVRFSPSGDALAIGTGGPGKYGQGYLVDLSANNQTDLLYGDGGRAAGISAFAFSHDGGRLAVGTLSSHVLLYDVARRTQVMAPLNLHEGSRIVTDIAFFRDGKRLAITSRRAFGIVFDIEQQSIVQRFQGDHAPLETLAIGAGQSWVAMAGQGRSVHFWKAGTWAFQKSVHGHEGAISDAAALDDGRLVTASEDQTVRIWSPSAPGRFMPFDLNPGNTNRVVWRTLEACGIDDTPAFFTMAANRRVTLHDLADTAVPADGEVLDTASIFETREPPALSAAAISRDGRLVALAENGGGLRLFERATGNVVWRLAPANPSGKIQAIQFSPDGKHAVAAGSENSLYVIPIEDISPKSNRLTAHEGLRKNFLAVAWSADSDFFLTIDTLGVIQKWPLGDWSPSVVGSVRGRATRIAINSSSDQIAVGMADGRITLLPMKPLDAESSPGADLPDRIYRAHGARVTDVCFIPNEFRLASTGADGRLRIWDTRTLQSVLDLERAGTQRQRLAWLPAERTLLVASDDGTLELLRSRPRTPRITTVSLAEEKAKTPVRGK